MVCDYCKNEFQPKNKKGKYCSAKCRVYAGREKERIVTIVTPQIVTPVTIPVTISKEEFVVEKIVDKPIEYYLEEYERVYLAKKSPRFINQKKWDADREKKLNDLMGIIEKLKKD